MTYQAAVAGSFALIAVVLVSMWAAGSDAVEWQHASLGVLLAFVAWRRAQTV